MENKIVGISYATEQKEDVDKFVNELRKLNISYFYDEEHPELMWGSYAPNVLNQTYRNFKCVVAFVSNDYLSKAYPRYEMLVSFHNELHQNGEFPYFLPIVYDDTKMPSFYRGFFYLSRNKYSIEEIAKILKKKLDESNTISILSPTPKSIIENCINSSLDANQFQIIELDSYDFIIKKISSMYKVCLKFKYDLEHKLYYVLDENDILKAAITNITNNNINILNYGLFASVEGDLSIDDFCEKLKRLLDSYDKN